MYEIAICENEPQESRELEEMLAGLLEERNVEAQIRCFSSAEELTDALKGGEQFHLLCLDILLGGRTGMELAVDLREYDERTDIVFITNSREFLKEGYEVRPLQYLYKPVQRAELDKVLEKALRRRPDTVSVTCGGQVIALKFSEILYGEVKNHHVRLACGEESVNLRISMSELERQLPAERFCRCHHSFLVNMSHIRRLDRSVLTLDNGQELPVSRNYYKSAWEKFLRFLSEY